jgi:excisionase family DNA binding protein
MSKATIDALYEHWFDRTRDANAAATLVLAQVQAQAGGFGHNLTVKEAANKLGVSPETVYKLCADGSMPCTRVGRRVVISSEQLAEYQSRPGYRHWIA